ncbi:glycosyltransferase family 2 protein [Fimbriiglobus ruber]|uniref:Glycosyl transferase, family 2 n=1 Tax=Fimbriiglobus ruber TaxID=1908690 RepID=A0A225E641_9BACT|nr:glycosyltransferase family 2 protein [Fimbriiglobus ruber]OWK44969.1 glycosyl transferase, family 2 [Fimbriiglobus ruber]
MPTAPSPAPNPPAVPDDVWVVVPAYNEGRAIGTTLAELLGWCRNVAVVDDGSADDTAAQAARNPVWVLRHAINRGQGAALQTGIEFALSRGAVAVVTFDSDGQHDPADIPAVVAPVLDGTADVTLGSRFLGRTVGIPVTRLVVLKLGIVFTRIVSRIAVTDTHNGFRALSRDAAQRIRITQDRMAHASEILDEVCRHGLRFREVPVTVRYTATSLAKGQSSFAAVRIAWQFLFGRAVQ